MTTPEPAAPRGRVRLPLAVSPSGVLTENVAGRAREIRMRNGVVSFAFGLVLAVVLMKLGAPLALRAIVVVPFYFGVMAMLQGLTST